MFSDAYFWLYFFASIVPVFALWLAWELRKSELRDSEFEYRRITKNTLVVLICAAVMFGLDSSFSLLPELLRWSVGGSFFVLLVAGLRACCQIIGGLRRDCHSAVLPYRN